MVFRGEKFCGIRNLLLEAMLVTYLSLKRPLLGSMMSIGVGVGIDTMVFPWGYGTYVPIAKNEDLSLRGSPT
ncbi:hypothetical protein C1H46_043489 [Malus baccata]|uniref:Uncharacterized protein n=1 Tax=Malus baccata TaxID=106549 RepID=A0A540K9Y6_MALBA|nr:hypothetical protein C1H46_043489 [Malus baccata]